MQLRPLLQRLILSGLMGLGLVAGGIGGGSASALSGSSFMAGRIIDDGVFYNFNDMTAAQVQSFLTVQVPSCDVSGDKPYYGTYGGHTYTGNIIRRNLDPNYPAPYTCLTNYLENTSTHANNVQGAVGYTTGLVHNCNITRGDPGFGTGVCTAAEIIYISAVQYGINPKVLLATMQKESLGSLITDDWPWWTQYKVPMGYGCPDSAPCDSQYFWFYNQVHNAARQFRLYTNNPNNYNYTIGLNNIKYHPDPSGCGTQAVNILNQATANLYDYTPYVPNSAALNNLYGLGDGCSSYGNRNFWRFYNDWFGSTTLPSYASSYMSQSAYPTIKAGTSATVWIQYHNAGAQPWFDGVTAGANNASPINLATTHGMNRSSVFGAPWGGDRHRSAGQFSAVYEADGTTLAANQHVAQPGQIARFSFPMQAQTGLATGVYREFFQPIVEGGTVMNDPWTFLDVTVRPSYYASAYAGQSPYPTVLRGQQVTSWFEYKNVGTLPWYDNSSVTTGNLPIHLATSHPMNRASLFGVPWGGDRNRASGMFAAVYEADGVTPAADQHVVQTGQIGKIDLIMAAPANAQPGVYREFFQPIVEGTPNGAMNDPWTFLDVTVQ